MSISDIHSRANKFGQKCVCLEDLADEWNEIFSLNISNNETKQTRNKDDFKIQFKDKDKKKIKTNPLK